MLEHVFAVGNLEGSSCKNSTVTGISRCGNTLQPVVKNKMSLNVMPISSSSTSCRKSLHLDKTRLSVTAFEEPAGLVFA